MQLNIGKLSLTMCKKSNTPEPNGIYSRYAGLAGIIIENQWMHPIISTG